MPVHSVEGVVELFNAREADVADIYRTHPDELPERRIPGFGGGEGALAKNLHGHRAFARGVDLIDHRGR